MDIKLVFWVILIATILLFVACNNRKNKTSSQQESIAVVLGEAEREVEDNSIPSMDIEIRGMVYKISVGEGIVGHYDKEEKYWVCSETEPIFETRYGNQKYTILEIRDKEEKGLVDDKGKIVVLPMYSMLQLGFSDKGFCKVGDSEGKYGLIAENGTIALPTIYDSIWDDDIRDGLIKVEKDGLHGYTDFRGNIVIPFKYEVLDQGGEGMIWFMQEPALWGCLNYKNEIVVQPQFTHPAPFVDGKAKAQKETAKEYFIYTDGRVEECPEQ